MSGTDELSVDRGAEWLRGVGEASDVVLSSRVRLARNLADKRFVPKMSHGDRLEVLERCRNALTSSRMEPFGKISWIELHGTPGVDRTLLVERHLISQHHARGKLTNGLGGGDEPRAVAVALPDERLSVMVLEEDHLRIQVIRSGLAFAETLSVADQIDDALEQDLDFAYSPRFGYLTACPTNVGTAARFSAMLHLPALRLSGRIDKVKRAAADMSLAVRGFYGEGSEAAGDLYQISNQTTLGKSEEILMEDLGTTILPRVIEYERIAREQLVSKQRTATEDRVHRALGTLLHARILTTEESMQLLSIVRMGVVAGLITDIPLPLVNRLMLLTQPAHLQRAVGQELNQDQRRAARATLIRARLSNRACNNGQHNA